jgi:hypothetical protein
MPLLFATQSIYEQGWPISRFDEWKRLENPRGPIKVINQK